MYTTHTINYMGRKQVNCKLVIENTTKHNTPCIFRFLLVYFIHKIRQKKLLFAYEFPTVLFSNEQSWKIVFYERFSCDIFLRIARIMFEITKNISIRFPAYNIRILLSTESKSTNKITKMVLTSFEFFVSRGSLKECI